MCTAQRLDLHMYRKEGDGHAHVRASLLSYVALDVLRVLGGVLQVLWSPFSWLLKNISSADYLLYRKGFTYLLGGILQKQQDINQTLLIP